MFRPVIDVPPVDDFVGGTEVISFIHELFEPLAGGRIPLESAGEHLVEGRFGNIEHLGEPGAMGGGEGAGDWGGIHNKFTS